MSRHMVRAALGAAPIAEQKQRVICQVKASVFYTFVRDLKFPLLDDGRSKPSELVRHPDKNPQLLERAEILERIGSPAVVVILFCGDLKHSRGECFELAEVVLAGPRGLCIYRDIGVGVGEVRISV